MNLYFHFMFAINDYTECRPRVSEKVEFQYFAIKFFACFAFIRKNYTKIIVFG